MYICVQLYYAKFIIKHFNKVLIFLFIFINILSQKY